MAGISAWERRRPAGIFGRGFHQQAGAPSTDAGGTSTPPQTRSKRLNWRPPGRRKASAEREKGSRFSPAFLQDASNRA